MIMNESYYFEQYFFSSSAVKGNVLKVNARLSCALACLRDHGPMLYNTLHGRKLRLFIVSKSISLWQALPA